MSEDFSATKESTSTHARENLEASKSHALQAAEELRAAASAKAQQLREAAEARAEEIRGIASEKAHGFKDVATEKAQEFKGAAEEFTGHSWEEAKGKAQDLHAETEKYLRENPTKAVLSALGVGFVIGLIFRR